MLKEFYMYASTVEAKRCVIQLAGALAASIYLA